MAAGAARMEAETKVYIGRGHEDTVSVIVGVGQRTGVCHASRYAWRTGVRHGPCLYIAVSRCLE